MAFNKHPQFFDNSVGYCWLRILKRLDKTISPCYNGFRN